MGIWSGLPMLPWVSPSLTGKLATIGLDLVVVTRPLLPWEILARTSTPVFLMESTAILSTTVSRRSKSAEDEDISRQSIMMILSWPFASGVSNVENIFTNKDL